MAALYDQRAQVVSTVTIADGQSLSGASRDLGSITLVGLILPGWTAAPITFQASIDGTNWYNLRDENGEVEIADPGGAAFVTLDPAVFAPGRYYRIRSGTSGSAVTQTPARTIQLVGRSVS